MSHRAFHLPAHQARPPIAVRGRMSSRGGTAVRPAAMVLLCVAMFSPSARAEDFFSALFGAIGRGLQAPLSNRPPFGGDGSEQEAARPRAALGGPAFCVRTCDGRYFPIPPSDQSRATACNNFCPAADTKVVYGGSIDAAATEDGKTYSQLPNAFRYRNELVAGCTCNGRDTVGLASIPIQDDPTLRRGDLVAGPDGVAPASGDAGRRASLNTSPAPDASRTR